MNTLINPNVNYILIALGISVVLNIYFLIRITILKSRNGRLEDSARMDRLLHGFKGH